MAHDLIEKGKMVCDSIGGVHDPLVDWMLRDSIEKGKMACDSIEEVHDPLVDFMEKQISEASAQIHRGSSCTIYKVHEGLRESDKVAYEPRTISIGPYYKSNPRLKDMEQLKWQFLGKYTSRSSSKSLKDYVDAIRNEEEEARRCYSEEIHLSKEEFVQVMVLDGCFILELLLLAKEEKVPNLLSRIELIVYDLFVLENQLPFFILQLLFDETALPQGVGTLTELALEALIKPCLGVAGMIINERIHQKKPNHLLHLLHSCLLPTHTSKQKKKQVGRRCYSHLLPTFNRPSTSEVESPLIQPEASISMLDIKSDDQSTTDEIPCATEINDAGIKFKRREEESSMLDIEFNNGVLEIPPFSIYDFTNSLFRNLIAMEQCSPSKKCPFSEYAAFMDSLINTEKDVALLYKKKIISHGLGSDEDVALLFNRLCNQVFVDSEDGYLRDVCKGISTYCATEWHTHRASLKRDYFSNPWASLSLLAGIVLLLLTIIQTIYTVLAYVHPPS